MHVGDYDVPSCQGSRGSVWSDNVYSAHASHPIFVDVSNPDVLFDARSGGPRPAEHNLIENGAPNRETVFPKWAKPMGRREFAVRVVAVRRPDPHAGQVGRV